MNSWLSTAVEIPPASLLEFWPLTQRGRVGGHELEYSVVKLQNEYDLTLPLILSLAKVGPVGGELDRMGSAVVYLRA